MKRRGKDEKVDVFIITLIYEFIMEKK